MGEGPGRAQGNRARPVPRGRCRGSGGMCPSMPGAEVVPAPQCHHLFKQ